MVAHTGLLPSNATKLELLLSEIKDPLAALGDAYDGIADADANPPPQFLPFLVWEYGLGELQPYLPNLYDLIAEGIRWQRVRGTPAAIYRGLSWLGYAGLAIDEPTRRKRWNRFQVQLDRVRDNDFPDLVRINGIVDLSPPFRSHFFRGFTGYDVRAAEGSYQRFSASLLSNYSGVRIEAGKAKWSFGRSYVADVTLSEGTLTTLGVWLAPVGTSSPWGGDSRLWTSIDEPWSIPGAAARINAMAAGIVAKNAYVKFKRGDGSTIGFRRALGRRVKAVVSGGDYTIAGNQYSITGPAYDAVLLRARTDFGDGAGSTAASISVVFDPTLAPGVGPGKLWLSPAEASGGVEIPSFSVSVPFGLTVRETVDWLLRF
jgi:hypothetical protein